MPSTFADVVVLVLAGIAAGNVAGLVMKDYSLGTIKNTLTGAIGGGAGYFVQALIPPMVDATGEPVLDNSVANHVFILALVGIAIGGMLTLVLGFVKAEAARSES